jgi:hypothetical protein
MREREGQVRVDYIEKESNDNISREKQGNPPSSSRAIDHDTHKAAI